jgi:hypothetical protein
MRMQIVETVRSKRVLSAVHAIEARSGVLT